ncbi:MAG: ATP-binding protein [Bacillota bacterium]|nr:ATP-binding protein [Bacillota bacterium]
MADSKNRYNNGSNIFRPRARLMRAFGDELISNENVAVIELVKNAYDADATAVVIKFEGPLESDKGSMEVIDNGNGMSMQTILNTWLEPATINRIKNPRSERYNRRVLGKKGIGRFAVSRLSRSLSLFTRMKDAPKETSIYIDWSQFEDVDKYLDEIDIPWKEISPRCYKKGGYAEKVLQYSGGTGIEKNHGTMLKMTNLRSEWSDKEFKDLYNRLSRLVLPFKDSTIYDFDIFLDLPDAFSKFSGHVHPPESLSKPMYLISGCVNENGYYNFDINIGEKPENIRGKFQLEDKQAPTCGPLTIELRGWDRDSKSIQEMGMKVTQMREDLDAAAGISIYRDGFRVFPYGEPGNDWLRLDIRSRQNPTMNMANNQLVGYVIISSDSNSQLEDQTNREGFLENRAVSDLKELIKLTLKELEKRRYAYKRRNVDSKEPSGGIFQGFNIDRIRLLVDTEYSQDKQLTNLIAATEKDLQFKIEKVQEVLSRYRRLATLGQLIDGVIHEGRTPVTVISQQARLIKRELEHSENEECRGLAKKTASILSQTETLSKVFKRIAPFGGRKRGKPVAVVLENIIRDGFLIFEDDLNKLNIEVDIPNTKTKVTADSSEIQEVIVNLLRNSMYWLKKVPDDERSIVVQIDRISENELHIIFSDSGPGVDPSDKDMIFEPYFSTRNDGVGLGLATVDEIVTDYYGGEVILLEEGPLDGASFKVILRRRV